jgi:DHA1 family inner membrane transport protein
MGFLLTTKLWLVLLACVLINASVLSTYAFIAPLLTERAGIPEELLPLSLVVFGLGALLGSLSSGRFGDRAPYATSLIGGTAVLAALGALCLLSMFAVPSVVLLALAGLFGMGTNPVLMALAVRYAPQAPTLATSLATSFFNMGTALGSWVTARAIDGAGTVAIPVVGAVFASLLLFPLTLLSILHRKNTTGEKQRGDGAVVRSEANAT